MEIANTVARIWAKSRLEPGSVKPAAWLPLVRHLDDSAAVAGRLWDTWVPANIRRQIAAAVGGDEQDGRHLAMFSAGVHDVGKASPAFAIQVPTLADRMRAVGFETPAIPDDERRRLRHELASQVALEAWLTGRFGWDKRAARQLGVVVGGHHGVPPEVAQLRDAHSRARRHLLGDGLWEEARTYLIHDQALRTGVADHLETWRDLRLPQTTQVLLTGIIIVADWIASNDELFPLAEIDDEKPRFDHDARVEKAWADLRLPTPWRPAVPDRDASDMVRSRFGLPDAARARPIQAVAFAMATTMDVPGLMVVEAPMGEGKTEAALLAAEALAARTGAGGCFVALPTQATSDAMFIRVLEWLARVPDVELSGAAADQVRQARSVTLSHGKAALNADFRGLRMRGRSRDVAADAGNVETIAHSWLSGRKKGPLSSFMVGTVDQLLLGSLRARHLALRHLGLAGKIVIVDEVHAYDAYMEVYLSRALEWLGAYGVPVVLLSATLPERTRSDLMLAYRRGVMAVTPPRRDSWRNRHRGEAETLPSTAPTFHYPAVTAFVDGIAASRPVNASGQPMDVRLETADDGLDTLVGVVDSALADGGCALIVRNTVRRAQECAREMRTKFGDDVILAHSRFLACDRVAMDAWLRERFGPPRPDGTTPTRPACAIVVATQVVEQSLDVDFDLLITDLAPIDLMLQRIGRMHRHRRGEGERHRPPRLRHPRCVVVGVDDWAASPPPPVRGSVHVYDEYSLYRAAALLDDVTGGGGTIRLPDDIAVLVQRAYGDGQLGPDDWQPAMTTARHAYEERINTRRADAATFRLRAPGPAGEPIVGWLHGHIGNADDSDRGQAQVRDGEDSIEALVLQESGGQLRIPDWVGDHGGELVPMNEAPPDALARTIASCSIRLPAYLFRGRTGDQLIEALETNWYPQLQHHRLLAGQLILVLDDDRRAPCGSVAFHYDDRDGLEMTDL